ncbi:MAG: radical SAM family heme chaperone HemW [Planctomycetota bacterium]
MDSPSLGLYVHVPFCESKCGYCTFASGTFQNVSRSGYVDAVLEETKRDLRQLKRPVGPVFVGGGTPSMLSPDELGRLLTGLAEACAWPKASIPEWTVECNPSSLDAARLAVMAQAGVNRISIGVQSMVSDELAWLERDHAPGRAEEAMRLLTETWGGRWSADLIYGVPGQTEESWSHSLKEIMKWKPGHLSLYELTFEEGSRLTQKRGFGAGMEGEEASRLRLLAEHFLEKQGLMRYEISNYAKPGMECRHNTGTWAGEDFLGVGSGAHSRLGDLRLWNTGLPDEYMKRMGEGLNPEVGREADDSPAARLGTALLLGLRFRDGVGAGRLKLSTGRDAGGLWPSRPSHWEAYLKFSSGSVSCTRKGWEVLDSLVLELLEKAVLESISKGSEA